MEENRDMMLSIDATHVQVQREDNAEGDKNNKVGEEELTGERAAI